MDEARLLDGIPLSAVLDSIRQIESGGGKYLHSPAGALGPYQFMPATAKAFGLEDPMSEEDSRPVAARLICDEYEALGTLDLALCAYNLGRTKLVKLMRANAATDFVTVETFLPSETRNYVHRFYAVLPHFLNDET